MAVDKRFMPESKIIDFSKEVNMHKELMLNAVKASGKVLLDYFGQNIDYEAKESRSSIVTKADIESEKTILNILQGQLPNYNYIAEESGFTDNNSEYTWIIDPLDGTSNYAAGIEWFGVMIALLKNDTPIMACMYLPCNEVMYFCEKGKGVDRNDTKITVSTETKLENILCVYCMDYNPDQEVTKSQGLTVGQLTNHVRNIRATNCLVDFCYVIDGRFGACINRATKIWDIAPSALMLEEAGGVLVDITGEKISFDLNKDNFLKTYQVIATNPSILPELLKII